MRQVSLSYARTHLSALAEEAAAGAVIIITKRGVPMAKLTPLDAENQRRV